MQVQQPRLSFWQIWNVSFGFLGVQFGFALQNANVSRILSDLGADLHSLSLLASGTDYGVDCATYCWLGV